MGMILFLIMMFECAVFLLHSFVREKLSGLVRILYLVRCNNCSRKLETLVLIHMHYEGYDTCNCTLVVEYRVPSTYL
jgi:hypothetical protein